MTKITALTYHNVDALKEPELFGLLDSLGATVAVFADDPHVALKRFDMARWDIGSRLGTRRHPYTSLHAIRRKLVKATEAVS